jgi:hypothetical protein
MKRLIALLLANMILLSACSESESPASGEPEQSAEMTNFEQPKKTTDLNNDIVPEFEYIEITCGYTTDYERKGIVITQYNGENTKVVVPDEIDGLPVLVIDEKLFQDRVDITSIELPESVTSIMWGAFYNCTGLSNIKLPTNLRHISGSAFYGCVSLTSITIPDSVTLDMYDYEIFYGCINLTEVFYKGEIFNIILRSNDDGDERWELPQKFYNIANGITPKYFLDRFGWFLSDLNPQIKDNGDVIITLPIFETDPESFDIFFRGEWRDDWQYSLGHIEPTMIIDDSYDKLIARFGETGCELIMMINGNTIYWRDYIDLPGVVLRCHEIVDLGDNTALFWNIYDLPPLNLTGRNRIQD